MTVNATTQDGKSASWEITVTLSSSSSSQAKVAQGGNGIILLQGITNDDVTIQLNAIAGTTSDVENHHGLIRSLNAYPNPFAERLTVSSQDVSFIRSAKLLNIDGKVVVNYDDPNPGDTYISLNTEQVQSGFYLLVIENDLGEVKRMKVVKH